jgi:hypothetical protein
MRDMRPCPTCVAALSLAIACLAARAGDAAKTTRPPAAAKLAAGCDDLVRGIVKRPYGWAWPIPADVAGERPKGVSPKSVPVSLEPGQTPAAGLILLLAGELLGEPSYVDAARNVARGVAAAQQPRGRFPGRCWFNPANVGSVEPPVPLPDRAPTRASLALLLCLTAQPGEPQRDEAIARAASRGAGWLMKQQTDTGAWPILYAPPAGDPGAKRAAVRLVRFDDGDARDNLLTMLLAYEALGDPFHRRCFDRGLEFLTRSRNGVAADRGAGMWQAGCTPAGQPLEPSADFPAGFDTLASRRNAQALFDAWVVLGGDGLRLQDADVTLKSIDDLVRNGEDGKWHRRYDARGRATDFVPAKPPDNSPFAPAIKPEDDAPPPSDPALAPTAAAVATAREVGREKFRERLTSTLGVKRRLALETAGIWDAAMSVDLPATAAEVDDWVRRHVAAAPPAKDAAAAAAAERGDMPARVNRIWESYLRAVAERHLSEKG